MVSNFNDEKNCFVKEKGQKESSLKSGRFCKPKGKGIKDRFVDMPCVYAGSFWPACFIIQE
jgi:hypothetical protein